jgi:uncharacterized Zn finger protein (UPF0148 family)
MSIKASCEHCKKTFSAPEEYRGRKVECPVCKRRFLLRSEDDRAAEAKGVEASRRQREEDEEKIELLERIEASKGRRGARPYYEEFQTGVEGVRHFNPRAPSRFLRLRAFSDFLVLAAYLEALLSLLGVGLLVYLRVSGQIASLPLLFLTITAALMVGGGVFLFFKYLGELAFVLADVGDQQNDLVQLLLDVRDNTDSGKAREAPD